MKKLNIMLEHELVTPRSDPVPHGHQNRCAMSLFILAVVMLLTLPRMVKADVSVTSQETLMQAQADEVLALEWLYGTAPGSSLNFNYAVDTSGGSFSWSTLPGQTYNGLSFSVSGTGSYNSSTTTYNWTASGQLGLSPWTEQGEAQWTGDPTANLNGTYTDADTGENVVVAGTVTVDATGHSSGNVTLNGVGNTPITDFIGTDITTIRIGYDPDFPSYVPVNGTWTPADQSGDMTLVPEPSGLALLGLGVVSLVTCEWRRRLATA